MLNVLCFGTVWLPGLILLGFKLIWVCREKDTDIAFAQEQIDDYKVSCEEQGACLEVCIIYLARHYL